MPLFSRLIVLLTFVAGNALAADISNPRSLIFVGDRTENVIDVISVDSNEVVYRIETSIHPDHIVVTPFAPILIYTNIDAKKLVFYDLENQRERNTYDLSVVPRHVVLDTTGARIGISDDMDGGFVLVNIYSYELEFSLPDFPASADVLFDPNDVDIYYSNQETGSIGVLNMLTKETYEIEVNYEPGQVLTPPSRSLDGRYIYVGNESTGEVYGMNAYSGAIFKTFNIGGTVARPYTTPEGVFLYMMDKENGRLVTIAKQGFTEYSDTSFGQGIDLVTVGRFDRLNLFTSSENPQWYIYDNIKKAVVETGEFSGIPISALGSADGKLAYVALGDSAELAIVDLEKGSLEYVPATNNGSGSFALGLSNNVCH
jgi:DNA-binding beta-propeller fold protein YncE